MRLAWTVADLASVRLGLDIRPGVDEVDTALRLRAGDPLDLRVALEEQAG
jgi:magnesium chelatase family protein